MLSLTLLFTSLLAGFAAAQNSTFDQNSVDLTTRSMLYHAGRVTDESITDYDSKLNGARES